MKCICSSVSNRRQRIKAKWVKPYLVWNLTQRQTEALKQSKTILLTACSRLFDLLYHKLDYTEDLRKEIRIVFVCLRFSFSTTSSHFYCILLILCSNHVSSLAVPQYCISLPSVLRVLQRATSGFYHGSCCSSFPSILPTGQPLPTIFFLSSLFLPKQSL